MEIIITIIEIAVLLAVAFYFCRWLDSNTEKKKKEEDPLDMLTEVEKEVAKKTTRMEKQMYNLLNYDGSSTNQLDLEDKE